MEEGTGNDVYLQTSDGAGAGTVTRAKRRVTFTLIIDQPQKNHLVLMWVSGHRSFNFNNEWRNQSGLEVGLMERSQDPTLRNSKHRMSGSFFAL